MAKERSILRAEAVVGGDNFFGDNKDMNGRLRMHIMKSHAVGVVVDDSGGDFPLDDLRENVVGKHGDLVRLVV